VGFLFDLLTDWILVGIMEDLRKRNPVLAWSLILIPLLILVSFLVWALLR
jgi:hypothetical protein